MLFLISGREPAKKKRARIITSETSSSSSSSSSDSDSDPGADNPDPEKPKYKIPKYGKIWSPDQIENLKRHFPYLEHLDNSILVRLSFKEMVAMGGKKDKGNRFLSEKLAQNYEQIRKFATRVVAGEDQCTGKAHEARFLRGYVSNSQELFVQARQKLGISGHEPISNYETVSVGLNGYLSARVWHEIHSPSSKLLSIRMLTSSALKSAWLPHDRVGEVKEFESLHELRMAVVALDAAIHKVMPWNAAFSVLAIFLHSVNFGERELEARENKLAFLADFIDEVIRFNAQAWDEERFFMSSQEVAAKWSALILRRFAPDSTQNGAGRMPQRSRDSFRPEDRVPPGLCRQFQIGKCSHNGDKHSAKWDPDYVLRHQCAQYLKEKKRYCFGNHAKSNHK